MMASEADTCAHGGAEVERLRFLDPRHRVDRNDERKIVNRRIGERRCRGLDADVKTLLLQPAAYHRRAQVRIVPRPAAPYNHCLAHGYLSSVDLPGLASRRHHRRPLDAAFDLDAPSLVSGGLERLH